MSYQHKHNGFIGLLIIMVLVVSMFSITMYLNHRRDYKISNTITACRDLGNLIQATNNHYAKFIKLAGEYMDSFTAVNAATESALITAWGNGTSLSMPSATESITSFVNRLNISSDVQEPPFNTDFVTALGVNSAITSYVSENAQLSHIPASWTVEITAQTPGTGQFDLDTLYKSLINGRNNVLSSMQGSQIATVYIEKVSAQTVKIRLKFVLPQHSLSMFYNYGM